MTAAALDLARAALRAGDAATARDLLSPLATDGQGGVIEALAVASYLDGEFSGAIEGWERAYAAHHRTGDQIGAMRVARTLAYMYFAIVGDFAVSGGWLARSQTLLVR